MNSNTNQRARALMVWGTSSGAGKSYLVTALCRWAANRGIAVAPFKAQNMSNNARVVPDLLGGYGEIGSAQYFQALAAKVTPTVDMNPVLLKPEADTASQVVMHGQVNRALSKLPWRERSAELAVAARASLQRLQAHFELIVIEGAGSPAEINLAAHDYVNLETARWAEAQAVLITDIDRGGAFAHLFGTHALLPDDLRPKLSGFVLNKFRGDPTLLAPGPELLQALTGVPVIGVLPMRYEHGLPEEDGVFERRPSVNHAPTRWRIGIVMYPRISNLDEFQPLHAVPGVDVVWVRNPGELADCDWIILPGSKQVSGDLAWLRQRGLDQAIRQHLEAGRRVLAICGGLQMLGTEIRDPMAMDGQAGAFEGLGLLPLKTEFAEQKRVLPSERQFEAIQGAWAALSGICVAGYEIRSGRTHAESTQLAPVQYAADGSAIAWARGSLLATYLHGLFENASVLQALFGASVLGFDAHFDALADQLEQHLDPHWLGQWTRARSSA